jgi:hypothetical protein
MALAACTAHMIGTSLAAFSGTKKQYLEPRLQIAPVGFAKTWNEDNVLREIIGLPWSSLVSVRSEQRRS